MCMFLQVTEKYITHLTCHFLITFFLNIRDHIFLQIQSLAPYLVFRILVKLELPMKNVGQQGS